MIQMNDFRSEPKELRREELAAVERVLRSGRFILGNELQQFEEAWAKFCGAKFCVGVANGMEAIELGLRALDIGPGDEVITTPMTAIATVVAIMHAGATPTLADIDPGTALLDLASVERCLTPQTRAVLLVHLYGRVSEMEHWTTFCKGARIHLLEDCAQAHGAVWAGRHVGTFGAWGAFSFYPTKNLGAKGDAGALVTNSAEIASRVKTLRNYGATKRYEYPETGLNSRLDELQAAILSTRLNWLEQFNARRQELARRFFAGIRNPRIQLLSAPITVALENVKPSLDGWHDSQKRWPAASHVYHLFVVRSAERNRLARFFEEHGIETLIHYPIPAHQQGFWKSVHCNARGLPNAESHAKQCLSLPCHPQLHDDDVAKVIATINQFE
jgi:dTDP-4-amino-4,6-dideoxygalactose transaminase